MYVVDTNIWLERLLDQARAEEVGRFLADVTPDQLALSDFSLHSIGVVLARLDRSQVFLQFVRDVLLDGDVALVSVLPDAMSRLVEVMRQFRLDFDDAYQYVAAEQRGATLVSFDGDFDGTERGRLTPEQVLTRG